MVNSIGLRSAVSVLCQIEYILYEKRNVSRMTKIPLSVKTLYIKKLYSKNIINIVILNWPSYRFEVSCIGQRPWEADQGPVTGPVQNHLINNIMI